MRKLLYLAIIALPASLVFSCSDDDGPSPEDIRNKEIADSIAKAKADSLEQVRLDSIEQARLDSIAKVYNDSMQLVLNATMPFADYGSLPADIMDKENNRGYKLIADTTWSTSIVLGDLEGGMTRRELDYAVKSPKALSSQITYLFNPKDKDRMCEAIAYVSRDYGKSLYSLLNWGYISTGSNYGTDYFISKDTVDFISVRDMMTGTDPKDFYKVDYLETSKEEWESFHNADRPAKAGNLVDRIFLRHLNMLKK